ncbi:MAG TPA: pectinesterase family protein [Candidatus Limnocylindrales bacterium]|nr:pectinesterase family protein [Candidatus Limnocylindrales bacterium]
MPSSESAFHLTRRGLLSTGAVAAGAMLLAKAAHADSTPCIIVASDGSGDVATVQAAIDAVPTGNTELFAILIRPGRYHGQVIIPRDKPNLLIAGLGPDPSDVEVTDDRANGTPKPGGGTWGTSGSASITIDAAGVSWRNLTLSNSFDEAAHPEITNRQAVAVLTRADRLSFRQVRFLGNQDTLYLNSSDAATVNRVHLSHCYIEGDVDFIFGRGTAVLEHCRIHSLDRGSATNNGYVTAASTTLTNPYGFLFTKCHFTANTATPATVYLGRPWHPSNDPNAVAQVVIRDSHMGEHIQAAPWTDFGTWPWREARYFEYRNKGPGAAVNADRPQLTDEQAASYTPEAYLGDWCL